MILVAGAAMPPCVPADPAKDQALYQGYFQQRFSQLDLHDFADGAYALDKNNRDNRDIIDDFPPYLPIIQDGEEYWSETFINGLSYADCFNGNPAQQKNYPRWDADLGMVVTLAQALNFCRTANGESPLEYDSAKLNALMGYMAYESRGQITQVKIPEDDERAIAAYEAGKAFYFRRRGQLNFACYGCHMESAGQHLRTETISPSLGQTSGWPTYRSDWGELGSLHRRFKVCNYLVRAKPFAYQSEQYRNLEYFLSHMSNGVPYDGPAFRK